MTRTRLIAMAASSVLVLTATLEAPAQFPGSYAPGTPPMQAGPVFSPYLNLLQRGNPAINYYGLVRPEIQFRNTVQSLASELEQTQAEVAVGGQAPALTQTGHPIQFFNLSHYYPGSAQGRVGVGAGVGARVGGATGYQAGGQNIGLQNFGGGATGAVGGAMGAAGTAGAATRGPSMPGR